MAGIGLPGTILMGSRSLAAQRLAIEVTGHNLSNVNTPNAARQRANLVTDITVPLGVGPQGTGSIVNRIEAVRSEMLDKQVVRQSSNDGFYAKKLAQVSLLQDVLAENLKTDLTGGVNGASSSTGLQNDLNQFFESLQALSADPTSSPYRSQVLERGRQLAASIRGISTRLTEMQANLQVEASNTATNINTYLQTIARLNQDIMKSEAATGYTANDLRDQRQEAVEKLSKLVSVKTSTNSINSSMIDVQIANTSGTELFALHAQGYLVRGTYYGGKDILGNHDTLNNSAAIGTTTAAVGSTPAGTLKITLLDGDIPPAVQSSIDPAAIAVSGELGALVDVDNYTIGTATISGTADTLFERLEMLADQIISEFNTIHRSGYAFVDSSGNAINTSTTNGDTNINFFSGTGASDIGLAITDPNRIAASNLARTPLNGENAIDLANLRYTKQNPGNGWTNLTITEYYRSNIVADAGFETQQATRDNKSQTLLMQQLFKQREAISGISVDEEMTDMVRFQRAFEASARFVSVADEMYSRVVNGMGAGR